MQEWGSSLTIKKVVQTTLSMKEYRNCKIREFNWLDYFSKSNAIVLIPQSTKSWNLDSLTIKDRCDPLNIHQNLENSHNQHQANLLASHATAMEKLSFNTLWTKYFKYHSHIQTFHLPPPVFRNASQCWEKYNEEWLHWLLIFAFSRLNQWIN